MMMMVGLLSLPRKTYRSLAVTMHPDKLAAAKDDPLAREEAQKAFVNLAKAYGTPRMRRVMTGWHYYYYYYYYYYY